MRETGPSRPPCSSVWMTLPASSNRPSAPCWALSHAATTSSTRASTPMNGRACRKQRSTKAESLRTARRQVSAREAEEQTCATYQVLPAASLSPKALKEPSAL